METKFDFKSQLCTSHEQSERLLALGLKKETADMVYKPHYVNNILNGYYQPKVLDKIVLEYMLTDDSFKDYIPAWSLHRLIEMMPSVIREAKPTLHFTICGDSVFYCTEDNNEEFEVPFSAYINTYNNILDCVKWLINEGYFNKEYLEDGND